MRVYVLAGQVATTAGPSVVLSFVIAAIASVFAGLCYAEFAARVPKAGSAYIYSYTTVGEFIGFVIGWNLILEYVIGTASVAKGFSGYVDSLTPDKTIATHLVKWLPLHIKNISPFYDIFALGVTLVVTVLLAFGVKESAQFTAVFTGINLYVVAFVTICGLTKIQNFKNWNLPPHNGDKGGFFPFGFDGMINGAARCFYGFVGFDAIASTGEEASNPQRSMPLSISLSLFLILLSYFGVAAASTLMWPYYYQTGDAPLADVFVQVGWPIGRYIIAVGAITSLTTALLGSLFPLPRVLFAMSTDGLLPGFLKIVNRRTKTPVIATLIAGMFAAQMSAIFTLQQLTDMMSIGTLLAYTLVTLSVLILRYQEDDKQVGGSLENTTETEITNDESATDDKKTLLQDNSRCFCIQFCVSNKLSPTKSTAKTSNILIAIICKHDTDSNFNQCIILGILIVQLTVILHFFEQQLFNFELPTCIMTMAILCLIVISLFVLQRQPQTKLKLPFKVPFLPYFPVISIFFNSYLMLKLDVLTWIRFAIWLTFGFFMYFGYGIFKSSGYLTDSEKREREEQRLRIQQNTPLASS
ncbi:high affinity cationic amino acid transporter 1-like isoform X5 [Dinothrombium tinctorium]|uniref:High affinity cationic amino acid transporter 1-like isoform X5 n=1 Tax=Dinothrombium tinctorium TaxID=1965070 RepID=A0A3S3SKK4_9ACAR|nr:high affinity cationic amino acid transporter 1-like isoform X5 [Dinothrombium tinctorium]